MCILNLKITKKKKDAIVKCQIKLKWSLAGLHLKRFSVNYSNTCEATDKNALASKCMPWRTARTCHEDKLDLVSICV